MSGSSKEYHAPEGEAGELAYADEEEGLDGWGFVEAEGEGDDVAHDGYPREEGEPHAVAVDVALLLLQRLGLYLQVLLYPFPLAEAANPVGGDAAQPVAERGHNEGGGMVAAGSQRGHIQRIGAEGHEARGQKTAYEKPEKSYFF